jgi:ATP-dependent exoDNAse (exonuclease V) beta subunit
MPTFIDHQIPLIEQINSETGRRYSTPEGKHYPSVTTVLSFQEKPELAAWRKRVGEETANRISRAATTKGSKVHEACENYLQGKETSWGIHEADAREAFQTFVPVLEKVNVVHAMETRMWSDKLEVAGTVDLIVEADGELAIWDWKTSSRYKRRDDIPDYFKQMATYSVMFYERTGIAIPNMVVQMTVPEVGLLTYKERVRDWVPEFIKARRAFKLANGY